RAAGSVLARSGARHRERGVLLRRAGRPGPTARRSKSHPSRSLKHRSEPFAAWSAGARALEHPGRASVPSRKRTHARTRGAFAMETFGYDARHRAVSALHSFGWAAVVGARVPRNRVRGGSRAPRRAALFGSWRGRLGGARDRGGRTRRRGGSIGRGWSRGRRRARRGAWRTEGGHVGGGSSFGGRPES